ncbi:MAG: OmpA family protein [Prevotella sp.]|nr:OmpA family protein [Prevotella sp.]
MKKLFLFLAATVLTASVCAQEKEVLTAHKTFDNWYLGFNGGAATPMHKWGDNGFMKGIAPSAGIRLGKNLTTVFGVAVDANAYLESDDKSLMKTRTFIDAINVDGVGTFNLSNFFGGYLGKPRRVELVALGGFGWTHQFGSIYPRANGINSKVALDLTFNLGSSRAVQFYLEPAFVFGMWDNGRMFNALSRHSKNFGYDSRSGLFQLNLGLNFKFGTSNGTKNFAYARLRDQSEIDDLNARINELRDENDNKDRRIARDIRRIAELEDSLEAAKKVKPTVVNKVTKVVNVNNNVLQPTVIFGQGKSSVDAAQMASVAMIAKYMKNHPESKILIKGYASPEGNPELNQRLSENRAQSVKDALVNRYGIAASRLTIQGMGATDELFDEIDFNRVATFTDTTK